jgi:N-acetyl-S-(2-succino)cysteine monooxygenase
MMSLMTGLHSMGYHPGGWRHPEAFSRPSLNLQQVLETAKTAERGKLDLLFLADGNGVRLESPDVMATGGTIGRPVMFEPVTLLSAVAMFTKNIGLLATATTSFEEPYTLARKFASLDHLSNGRAAWNIVTSSNAGDALNFSRTEHMARTDRYERAREFVEVCKGLWDSWAEDAFPQDKETGRFTDPSKVHLLNHKGQHFQIKGPLNISRMPQGYPVLFMAGQSEPGREFSASTAECQFAVTPHKDVAMKTYADIKGRMAKYGRTPDMLKIMPGAAVYVAKTRQEAEDLFEEMQSKIAPVLGVAYLSSICEADLSKCPIDGPLPDLSYHTETGSSRRKVIYDMATRENLTIRQTYERVMPTVGHVMMKGSPTDVADMMEDWYKSKACDGFNVHIPLQPLGLNNFVDLVVPELQKRGVFKKEYEEGRTLRERLGLPMPVNPYFPAQSVAAAE